MVDRDRGVRALTWLAIVTAALPACAQAMDARFVEGLRQRRLFELAEAYCTEQLHRATPGDPVRAELTVELIRTLALHAANAPLDQRDGVWQKARAVAASFMNQSPAPPRSALVRFQDALTLLAQGELARQEREAGALPVEQLEAARQALRQATTILGALEKELKTEIPLRRRAAASRPGELSADELTRLQEQIEYQLALANKCRGLLFDRGSDDRLALLLAAVGRLERLSAQIPQLEPLHAAIQLDLAACQRLLGRYAEAESTAASLDRDGIVFETRLEARAELMRVAIAQSDYSTAQRLMDTGSLSAGTALAEWDFARFEALLAMARAASEGKRFSSEIASRPQEMARAFQQRAAEQAELIEKTHGLYWGRRASQLLIAAMPRSAMGSAELLGRAADGLYLKGDWEQAIAAYDEAAAQAKSKGDAQAAFEQSYKAALAEQKRGRAAAASDRLRVLANGLPAHPHAAQAHLLAVWNAGQEAANDPAAAGQYQELLREHLARWPAAETANQARLWLGRFHEGQADWPAAIEAYAGISKASPHYAAAIGELAATWRRQLDSLAAVGQPTTEAAADAIRFFQRTLLGSDNRWPERWTEADRTAALTAAELIVAYQAGSASDAENLLRRAIAGSLEAPPAWQADAQAQLVVALAAQGSRQNDALAELRAIGANSSDQMLTVLEGLSQVAARGTDRGRQQIAALQLEATALIAKSSQQLTKKQRLALERVQAEALASTGRRDEALARYRQLVSSNPDNSAVQTGYAKLLLASADAAQLKKGLDQWRIVASRTPPRTPPWFEAKYSVALAQFKLGDRAGAAALLRFLLETPPGMKGSEWAAAYADLLKKCGQ